MADLFRSVSDRANTASVNAVGDRPTGTADGDYLVATVIHTSSSLTITEPAGWARIQEDPTSSDFTVITFGKYASSEPADWTWTISGAGAANRVTVVAFQGVHSTLALHASFAETTPTTDTSLAIGALTPTVDGCTILTSCTADASTGTRTFSADGSPSERADAELANAPTLHGGWYTEEQVTAASITRTVTISGLAQEMSGHIIAIRPAAGGATTRRYGLTLMGAG